METATLKYSEVKNYVSGKFLPNGKKSMEVISPLTGKVISTLPLSTAQDLDEAVKAAKAAFPAWSAMHIKEIVQIFYRCKTLMEKRLTELSNLVSV